MNVSRLPLQKKLYPYSVRRRIPPRLLPAFRVIRKDPNVCVERRRRANRYFAALIQDDLKNRIGRVRRRLGETNVKFVSCGDVAKAYLEHLNVETCHDLNHPARGWDETSAVTTMVRWYRDLATGGG